MDNWYQPTNISCAISELDPEEYPFLFMLFDEEKKLLTFDIMEKAISSPKRVILGFEDTIKAQHFLHVFCSSHKASIWKVDKEGYERLQKDSGLELVLYYPQPGAFVGFPGYYHYN